MRASKRWLRALVSRREIWASLKIGTGVLLALIIGQLVVAHLPETWATRLVGIALYPGFGVAARLLHVGDVASYSTPYGEISLLGVSLDIGAYSAAVWLLRGVTGVSQRGPAKLGRASGLRGERKLITDAAWRAAKIGYAIAIALCLLMPLVSGHESLGSFDWLFAGGDRVYRALFGDPSHGLSGDVWLIGMTILNGAIYAALVFVCEMAWNRLRPARADDKIESLGLR